MQMILQRWHPHSSHKFVGTIAADKSKRKALSVALTNNSACFSFKHKMLLEFTWEMSSPIKKCTANKILFLQKNKQALVIFQCFSNERK